MAAMRNIISSSSSTLPVAALQLSSIMFTMSLSARVGFACVIVHQGGINTLEGEDLTRFPRSSLYVAAV